MCDGSRHNIEEAVHAGFVAGSQTGSALVHPPVPAVGVAVGQADAFAGLGVGAFEFLAFDPFRDNLVARGAFGEFVGSVGRGDLFRGLAWSAGLDTRQEDGKRCSREENWTEHVDLSCWR